MARFYPTTILAVLICLVLLFFFYAMPKVKKDPQELDKKDIIISDEEAKPLRNSIQDTAKDTHKDVKEELSGLKGGAVEIDAKKAPPEEKVAKSKIVNDRPKERPKVPNNQAVAVPVANNAKLDVRAEPSSSSDVEDNVAVSRGGVINVMVTSDNRTLGGLVAAVNSIYKNTMAHVRFYLLVDAISVSHLKTWIQKTELKDIDYVLKAFNESLVKNKIKVRDARKDLASPLNFARYYFPVVFPTIENRLIFIDADSLVQGDIQDLWDMKLQAGHAAAFSDDCTSITHRSSLIQTKYMDFLNFKNPTIKALNMNPMTCSFNTGVFLIDVNEWRRQRITKQLDKWLALNSDEELYGSQRGGGNSGPPFYIVFYNKYTQMSPAWNVRHLGITTVSRYSDPFVKSAKLLHWNGPYKPWGRTAQHVDDWDKYYISDPTGQFKVVRKYQTI